MTSWARSSAEQLAQRLDASARGAAAALRRRAADFDRVPREAVARWLAAGERLAVLAPDAAAAWFEGPIGELSRLGDDAIERCLALVAEAGAHAPALAASLARGALPVLTHTTPERLAAWVQEAIAIFACGGWRAERRAQAFLEASTGLTALAPALLGRWQALAPHLTRHIDEPAFFAALPASVGRWSEEAQDAWLRLAEALALRTPALALEVYRDLPDALATLAPAARSALLAALATAAPAIEPGELARVVPVLGPLVAAVPAPLRPVLLPIVGAVAAACPRALCGLLRVLPRLAETASAERLRAWGAWGTALAAEHPQAAIAYFALASRTSERVLHASSTAATLEEQQGVLRRFVHMLSGEAAVPRAVEAVRLRLPFEDDPAAHGIALPGAVDALDTYEDNARLLRLLAGLLAGRREFGTYASADLRARLGGENEPPELEDLVLLTDGYRTAVCVRRRYPGLAADLAWAVCHCLGRAMPGGSPQAQLDAILALALADEAARSTAPRWLRLAAAPVLAALAPLAEAHATIDDAIAVARALAPLFEQPPAPQAGDAAFADLLPLLLDEYGGEGAPGGEVAIGGDGDATDTEVEPITLPPDLALALGELLDDPGTGAGLSPEELRRLLEAGFGAELAQGRGDVSARLGLYVTQLVGKRLRERAALAALDAGGTGPVAGARRATPDASRAVYLYDEWDHVIGDYRRDWCRLRELAVAEDAGVFYERTLARHAELVPEIRRHFQRVRPELYRTLRGLEDGCDFDLGAVVDARAQLRARRTPSPKLYTKRMRQERDVATLFLVDLSASTDEAAPDAADGARIIDITREALVLMAAALEEMGDAYAIYGFSGQGRENVEFFPVKDFGERLTPAVKGRIGGLAPRGSTRMGTALRHAVTKLRGVTAPQRHLLLLSDGFPQDLDYGQDRQSHLYGIRDTATALREAQAAGVRPFCITVDAAGHDYLREMCDPRQYLVIDRVGDLPRELPKIYQRLVWAA